MIEQHQSTEEPWEHCGVLACAMRAQCVQPQDCKSGQQQHQMTKAEQLAQAVWKAGNRHGPDAERKAEILRLCNTALSGTEP